MTDIGELVVRIKADATQLQQELGTATQAARTSSDSMVAAFESVKGAMLGLVPVLSIAGLVQFGKSAVENASNLQNMADRIGFSASTLSALQPILAKSGSGVDELSHSVYMMNNFMQQAIDGNPKAIATLDDLGLSATKLKAMKPEDAFYAIVNAIHDLDSITKQTEDGRAIFSRSFATLIPLIKESNGNLGDTVQRMKDVGGALTDEEIGRVHEFGAALEDSAIRAKNAMTDLLYILLKIKDAIPDFEKLGEQAGNAAREALGLGPSPVATQQDQEDVNSFLASHGVTVSAAGSQNKKANPAAGNNNDLKPKTIAKDPSLESYISQLNQEASAAAESSKELFIQRAEIEAGTKAREDYTNQLRTSKDLTNEEAQQVRDAAAALYDHKEALTQNKQIADQLSASLEKIVMNFKDMKTAITDLFNAVASEIVKNTITKPLGDSISGLFPTSGGGNSLFNGLGKVLGFASGGNPPVGVPSIVGENGPELFVPNSAGTIVPNGGFGGSTVIVQQTINMQPGLAETVNAAIRNAAPSIAAMAHAGVMNAIQKGGPDAQVVGLRT